jgi:hypothetical protein
MNRDNAEKILEIIHKRIDELGLSPCSYNVYDDNDMIAYALNFLLANLESEEIFLPLEEEE